MKRLSIVKPALGSFLGLGAKQSLYFKSDQFEDSSLFEILLFKTKLSFKNPKASAKPDTNFDGSKLDMRPFVNTESKVEFANESDDAGSYACTFYATAWGFYRRKLWSKPVATLKLNLDVQSVTKTDVATYADLYEPETAKAWLKYSVQAHHAFMNEIQFTPVEGGHSRIDTRSAKDARKLAGALNISVVSDAISGLRMYQVSSFPNQLDFYFPFSKRDMVQFSFRLVERDGVSLSIEEKKQVFATSEVFSSSLINTVEILRPERALK